MRSLHSRSPHSVIWRYRMKRAPLASLQLRISPRLIQRSTRSSPRSGSPPGPDHHVPPRARSRTACSRAFVNTLRRDYFAGASLLTADAVLDQLPAWFAEKNAVAPHSALGYKSPQQYRTTMLVAGPKSNRPPVSRLDRRLGGRLDGWHLTGATLRSVILALPKRCDHGLRG